MTAGARWRRWLSRLMFWGGVVSVPALAGAAPQSDIPPHWMSYAHLVGNQFQVWLHDTDNADAVLLHDWIERYTLAHEGQPPAPVVVRASVSAAGEVTTLQMSSTGNPNADQWLDALLRGRQLTEAPPRDMPQPLVLRLNLAAP
ncbi:hypothetical protein A167_03595 [Alcanivorax sp. S71-1-4]|nr:hypothetical protein A167_03595 [Alcanivorax sp. S71-1-4]